MSTQRRAQHIREAFEHLHEEGPVLAALIDERPDYDPDAWLDVLPDMNLFGCPVFEVVGQQISVKATRAIFGRLADRFDGRVPSAEGVARLD